MTLSAGTRLGPYQIVQPLGAGGMGEVYKGRDTRLERTVAVKILSASSTDDPSWRQRFDREARALAVLRNPHICPVFDVGSQDGTDFLVMEYLEGETLAARLARGPLPVDQALRYAVEIADALAAAHRQGVCHRDLKPSNVMLTRSGARLLDFGLAKLGATRSSQIRHEQTTSSVLTAAGTILGTIQYMAPEQLEGKETDGRSDIFSFGAMVYEMVTGRKAFEGGSQASLIAAILEHEPPPMSSLQQLVPPALDRVAKRCLAKDPEERWQNALDLRDELKWIAESAPQRGVLETTTAVRRKRTLLSWALVSALSAALLTLGVVHLRGRSPKTSRVIFTVARPRAVVPMLTIPVLAPDGEHVVFPGANADGRSVLWIRSLDTLTTRPLAETENDGYPLPFWSPDGRSLGFIAEGKLKTIEVSGGTAHTLADAPDAGGGTWSPEGIIVFVPRRGPLYRVSASGGPATPLLELDRVRQEVSHSRPSFLPDGRHLLYLVESPDPRTAGIYVTSVAGEKPRLLIREHDMFVGGATQPGRVGFAYSLGYLLFLRDGTLFAQSFDVRRAQLTGEAFPIPGQGGEVITPAWGRFSVSQNGVLAYIGRPLNSVQLILYDRRGKVLEPIGKPAAYSSVALSPDEKRVAVERADPKAGIDVWMLELSSGISTRLTFGEGGSSDPVWSPDGRQLAYVVFRGYAGDLYRTVIAKGGQERLFESGESNYPQQWSNDGRSILFINQDGKSLYRLPLSGGLKPEVLLRTSFAKDEFHLSPDGRWIAYNSLESGQWEVYVASFPSFAHKRQVSRDGGCQPLWRKDGKELFYLGLRGALMSVDVSAGSSFEASVPRLLFQTPIIVNPVIDQYCVTGDGQRFLLATPVGEAEPITVMLNWAAGLER